MPKLTIVRGISGSGKSTWANSQNAVVISRDLIRLALFGTESMADEERVTNVEHSDIRYNLQKGKDVISDNTNIEWKFVKKIAEIGFQAGAEVVIKTFDIPLEKAIQQNDRRAAMGGRMVPHEVIKRQHQRFQGTKNKVLEPVFQPKPYFGTPGKPKALIVDIDGTLAHMRDYRGPFDWHKVGLDDADENIVNIAEAIRVGTFELGDRHAVIVMSGRDEVCRKETELWLEKHYIVYDELLMRPEKDMRKDNIVKAELFDKYIRDNFDVKFVLDDRDQVVRMWRAMGLTCLQVAEGDF